MLNLAEQLKKINLIVRNSYNNEEILINILKNLQEEFDVDSVIIDANGTVIYERINKLSSIALKNQAILELENKTAYTQNIVAQVEDQLCMQINNLVENKLNVKLSYLDSNLINKKEFNDVYGSFIPIISSKIRVATLIFYRKENKFDDTVYIINEFLCNLVGIALSNQIKNNIVIKERELLAVKSAIHTLSYTELEVIINIFMDFEGTEKTVIMSKLADRVGIARSVIVNALRKFESAGIIESRSMGMKGTHIKITNKYIVKEINKFKK